MILGIMKIMLFFHCKGVTCIKRNGLLHLHFITDISAGDTPQYGSDAIAGVLNVQFLNVQLKESTGNLLINANIGQFYAGDGFKSWLGIYRGFRLRNKKLSAQK